MPQAAPGTQAYTQAAPPQGYYAYPPPQKKGGDTPGWVLHARGAWTQAQWESAPEAVIETLVRELETASGASAGPVAHAAAHRWRYARAAAGLTGACLWDAEARVGACGDRCGGPGLEGAWHSGRALAERIG